MKTEMRRAFGARLAALRESRGMRQGDVAAMLRSLGVDKHDSAVSKTESGTREPGVAELIALAQIYQVPVEALFTDTVIAAAPDARRLDAEGLANSVLTNVMEQLLPAERARSLAYLNDRFGGAL